MININARESFNRQSVLELWRETTDISIGIISQYGLEFVLSDPVDVALEQSNVDMTDQSNVALFRDITTRALQAMQQDVIRTIEQASSKFEEEFLEEWIRATEMHGEPINASEIYERKGNAPLRASLHPSTSLEHSRQ